MGRPGVIGPREPRPGGSGPPGAGPLAAWEAVPREFFGRSVLAVAPDLLGRVLAHQTRDGLVAVEIVEVEAYRGELDPASHAFRGKTARNAVMFGAPGHAYVYFTYGMHFCVNLVCEPAGEAAAVLVRAGRVVAGLDLAVSRRAAEAGPGPGSAGSPGDAARAGGSARAAGLVRPGGSAERLASGPARLCQALGIDRAQDGADVCDPASSLRLLAPPGFAGLPPDRIARGPRVGVRNGAQAPWRFWIAADAAVSAYRPHVPRRRAAAKSDVTTAPPDGSMQR